MRTGLRERGLSPVSMPGFKGRKNEVEPPVKAGCNRRCRLSSDH